MDLLDIIPVWAVMLSASLCLLGLAIFLRFRVIRSVADPNMTNLFQAMFTFFVLLLVGDLLIVDAIGFLIFCGLLIKFQDTKKCGTPIISNGDWVSFCKVFVIVLLILNIYLLTQKGFLLFSEDIGTARLEFYQGWGLFSRLNAVGVGLTVITAATLWYEGHRKQAIAIALFSAYLSLMLGSRSGLLACLFAYGAYLHFSEKHISTKRIMLAGATLGLSSLVIFFVMFGTQFLGAFAYRVVSYADGPIYYFHDHMDRYTDYPPTYMFGELLTDLRLQPNYEGMAASDRPLPLGRFINFHHFGSDTLLVGPNPQLFVESHAAFHWLSIFWYVLVAVIFILLRRKTSTAFSFYLGCSIAGPLLGDATFAGSQVFTVMLILSLVGAFLLIRYVLRQASAGATGKMVKARCNP